MGQKKKTIKLAKIRREIRNAIRWHEVDNGMPTHWSTLNYHRSISMKGLILTKKEKDYYYYTKSSKAIEDIAQKILKIANDK